MGLYIKGMEVPKDCGRCFVGDRTICANGCPLVTVKEPHGRLIDADELQEAIGDAHFKNWGNAVLIVKDAPTVIDAEGEEKGARA